jgi:two-component system LytT family response regulator
MIRALIVDDEPWARKRLATLLAGEADVEVVGECATGEDAVERTLCLRPDVMFLDVQMPEMDGFEVLEALPPERRPCIVFVTAYDQYAIKAFEADAVDYLLKPFEEERFGRTLERLRRRELRPDAASPDLAPLLARLRQGRRHLRRLVVHEGERVLFFRCADVDYVEASANYLTLHIGERACLLRETMSSLESKLDPDQFVRIHRSTIVNLDRARELRPYFNGQQVLVLKDGTELRVGRAYRERLRRWLENAV